MGSDVFSIGRHNLDTSSLEALAKDISNRFKANVEYGVYDTFFFDWDGFPREATGEYWVFGRVEYPNAEKTLWLSDEYYLYHIVQNRYGDDANIVPHCTEHKYTEYKFDEALNNVCFELREENPAKDEYGTIYNDTFHNLYNCFDYRWYSFCRAFTEEDSDKYLLRCVTEYRCEVMNFFEKLGGAETFYINDQGETEYLMEAYDWETILKEIKTNFKETTLDISDFMEHENLLPEGEYPSAFYDDFADLNNRKQIKKDDN